MANAVIIKQLISELGLSIAQFEKEIGASNGLIAKNFDRDAELSGTMIRKILKRFPQVSERWLETGSGEMMLKNSIPEFKTDEEVTQAAVVKMMFNELAKIKAKVFEMKLEDCLAEFEHNTTLIIKDILDMKP